MGMKYMRERFNERGSLEVEVTKLAKDNTISRIIHMVEEAQGQRAPSQQFVDKFAQILYPRCYNSGCSGCCGAPVGFRTAIREVGL